MKAYIFEKLEDLNSFLSNIEARKVVDIKFQSQIVSKAVDVVEGKESFVLVDRFLVLTK